MDPPSVSQVKDCSVDLLLNLFPPPPAQNYVKTVLCTSFLITQGYLHICTGSVAQGSDIPF